MKTVPDLMSPNSPGAQPFGGSVTPTVIPGFTSASTALPARPVAAPATPARFLVTFAGVLGGVTSITAQVVSTPTPLLGDYFPGDVVRFLLQPANAAAHTVAIVDGGTGTPTLATMPSAIVNSQGGFIEIQLNAAGTHWTLTGFGGF
jgi:hypothetical protein